MLVHSNNETQGLLIGKSSCRAEDGAQIDTPCACDVCQQLLPQLGVKGPFEFLSAPRQCAFPWTLGHFPESKEKQPTIVEIAGGIAR
jgi:hypothetical protein